MVKEFDVVIGGEPADHSVAISAGEGHTGATCVGQLKNPTHALELGATYLHAGCVLSKGMLSLSAAAKLKSRHLLKASIDLCTCGGTREEVPSDSAVRRQVHTELANVPAENELIPSAVSATSCATERVVINFIERRQTGQSSLSTSGRLLSFTPAFVPNDFPTHALWGFARASCQSMVCLASKNLP